jgi:hypothetical protein
MKPESFQKNFYLEADLHQSARFPLTPALSSAKRENPAPSYGMAGGGIRAVGSRKAESIQSLFPLRGEGQGEGNPTNQNSTLANKA